MDGLTKGNSDLAVSVFPDVDASIQRIELLRETYSVAMRKAHPAAADFTLARWLAFPHILVSGRGETQTPLDRSLAQRGLHRRVGMVLPSFLMVPPLLLASDMIAMLPSRCLPSNTADDFAVFAPPIPAEGFPLHLAWHNRRRGDAGVQHVATMIRDLLKPE
ncbi:LysR substrate-binding domain-containing protein [Elstera litoralis]|uniref:LysR substrate-binding domain-containing protein n=1 Tax=Elstera litoralis TaxID=552518 RepID=UPI0018DCA138|nr:LysR substrate-binding domain-containing protein [Elstera litoralis]